MKTEVLKKMGKEGGIYFEMCGDHVTSLAEVDLYRPMSGDGTNLRIAIGWFKTLAI